MKRLTITHEKSIDPMIALERVKDVMSGGRVSNEGKCYCFATAFGDGVLVLAARTSGGADSFKVMTT